MCAIAVIVKSFGFVGQKKMLRCAQKQMLKSAKAAVYYSSHISNTRLSVYNS